MREPRSPWNLSHTLVTQPSMISILVLLAQRIWKGCASANVGIHEVLVQCGTHRKVLQAQAEDSEELGEFGGSSILSRIRVSNLSSGSSLSRAITCQLTARRTAATGPQHQMPSAYAWTVRRGKSTLYQQASESRTPLEAHTANPKASMSGRQSQSRSQLETQNWGADMRQMWKAGHGARECWKHLGRTRWSLENRSCQWSELSAWGV